MNFSQYGIFITNTLFCLELRCDTFPQKLHIHWEAQMTNTPNTSEAWDTNAAFWDQMMGEGNAFHRTLIAPHAEAFLPIKPGQKILDIACGNGHFPRRLAELGANVVAFDGSRQLIEIARQKSPPTIEYHVIDATHQAAIEALGHKGFDAAVCNMALMDIATLDPLFKALRVVLKEGAPFVFSIAHPCFNMPHMSFFSEMTEEDGQIKPRHGVKINHYITPGAYVMRAMEGQAVPHKVYHRSLSLLLRSAFQAGFVLEDCREPSFKNVENEEKRWGWQSHGLSEIPPVFIGKLR